MIKSLTKGATKWSKKVKKIKVLEEENENILVWEPEKIKNLNLFEKKD
jgi:hypothetical protein